MELVKNLVSFANKLDAAGVPELGNTVDSVARGILKIAQYVGAQGYWVRNERCWSNCYRQKRASKPSLSAQEVWFECQNEFQKSINNDGSKWDKYAESSGIIKTADFDQDQQYFAKFIESEGVDVQEIATIVTDGELDSAKAQASSLLGGVSEKLASVDTALSEEASLLAEQVLKEAGFMDFMRGVGQGAGGGFRGRNAAGAVKGAVSNLQKAWQGVVNTVGVYNKAQKDVTAKIQQVSQSKHRKAQYIAQQALTTLKQLKGVNINQQLIQMNANVLLQLNNIAAGIDASFDPSGATPASPASPASSPAAPASAPASSSATPGGTPNAANPSSTSPTSTASPAAPAAVAPSSPAPASPFTNAPPANMQEVSTMFVGLPAAEQQALLTKLKQMIANPAVQQHHDDAENAKMGSRKTLYNILKTSQVAPELIPATRPAHRRRPGGALVPKPDAVAIPGVNPAAVPGVSPSATATAPAAPLAGTPRHHKNKSKNPTGPDVAEPQAEPLPVADAAKPALTVDAPKPASPGLPVNDAPKPSAPAAPPAAPKAPVTPPTATPPVSPAAPKPTPPVSPPTPPTGPVTPAPSTPNNHANELAEIMRSVSNNPQILNEFAKLVRDAKRDLAAFSSNSTNGRKSFFKLSNLSQGVK